VFVINTEMESEIGTDPGIALFGEFQYPLATARLPVFPFPG
jgi:hypothetical protein